MNTHIVIWNIFFQSIHHTDMWLSLLKHMYEPQISQPHTGSSSPRIAGFCWNKNMDKTCQSQWTWLKQIITLISYIHVLILHLTITCVVIHSNWQHQLFSPCWMNSHSYIFFYIHVLSTINGQFIPVLAVSRTLYIIMLKTRNCNSLSNKIVSSSMFVYRCKYR